MTEALFTATLACVEVIALAVSSVVMAVTVKGDRVLTWSGFGVSFRISPCSDCPIKAKGVR